MSTAVASESWNRAPSRVGRPGTWHFARPVATGFRVELRRNLSLTPRQMGLAYGLLCLLSLAVALGFWLRGVHIVLAFTGLELLAVGFGLVAAARHATDRDIITFAGRRVEVEQHVGLRVLKAAFRVEWLRVEPAASRGGLIELSGGGRRVSIGRHVRPERRPELARELQQVAQLQRHAPAVDEPSAPGCTGADANRTRNPK